MKKFFPLCLSLLLALPCLSAAESAGAPEPLHDERAEIESALNLRNMNQEWTYDADSDSWTLSIVTAVTKPLLPDQQGVSVCVPGAYVTGIDTDGDGAADAFEGTVKGALVIDYEVSVASEHGQTYTAATAPVILNTGAAGYGSSMNTVASSTYAEQGYINVSCGNRGKQDTVTADGVTTYTGDAPSCLVDQKNAARFVKYNILLGNLPGCVDRFVSTGGSGGGAHALMFATTSNSPDFYPYEIDCGAVGVYQNPDGSFDTTVEVNGERVALSDGAWGCVAYSGITSLSEADMTMAFEYNLDTTYDFSSAFQKKLASILSAEYMQYINSQNLAVDESLVGFDLDGDGQQQSRVPLTIEYDAERYAETNGYGGTYLTLYLAEFTENLQWMIDNLAYASDWTWFNADGTAMTDEQVAAMTDADRTAAFLEGRYAKSSTRGMGGPGGMMGGMPDGKMPDGMMGGMPGGRGFANGDVAANSAGDTMDVGTPDAGTTQAAGSSVDSANYASYDEMVAAYEADIAAVQAGDIHGNNQVDLYNPLRYIGRTDTQDPAWARIMMGAAEGDLSMFNSLNLQIAMLNSGIDAEIEWQWDGGHVPSEILGSSLSLWVDMMVGEHVAGASTITKDAAEPQTKNGTATEATGKDITSWVTLDEDGKVSFSLASAAAYRTAGASKAIPGFDVIDYGQEDYVFGNAETDARHWDKYVLQALKENADVLSPLFNQ